MRRLIFVLLKLFVVLLCLSFAAAAVSETGEDNRPEAQEIRFLDIPWGSDMDTVCQKMFDAGLINEDGVAAFRLSETRKESALKRNGRRRDNIYPAIEIREGGCDVRKIFHSNVWETSLMSSNIAGTWMGVDIHHIFLYFAMDGDTEKLIEAVVALAVNRTDLTPELEKIYGGQYLPEGSKRYKTWTGANRTALVYDGSEVISTVLNAGEILDASVPDVPKASPTPEPTPEPPVIGEDLLDYPQEGEYTFLQIPWDSDVQTTIDAMVAQRMITRTARTYLSRNKSTNNSAMTNTEKGWKIIFPAGNEWTGYCFIRDNLTKTIAGYLPWMVTLTFRQDGDRTMLKEVSVSLKDIDAAAVDQAIRERFTADLGEGTELYGSWYWNGENNTVISTHADDDYFNVVFAAHVPEE